MAHRTFVDSDGVTWQVWEVVIHPTERIRNEHVTARLRRARQTPTQRENLARRLQVEQRVALPAQFEHGWLAFGSIEGNRRLAPIPPNWMTLSDDALNELCRQAHSMQKPGTSRH
jgi:hypothetical protein